MATVSLTIPDAIAQRVLNGMAYYNGYQDEILDSNNKPIPNPETKMQFVKRILKLYIKNCVVTFEAQEASNTARQNAITSAETDITLGD